MDFRSPNITAAVQQQIIWIASELASRGHEVYIIRRWMKKPLYESYNNLYLVNIDQSFPFVTKTRREDTLNFIETISHFIVYLLYCIKTLIVIRKIRPDVVNISSLLVGFFIANKGKPRNVFITHGHDIFVHDTPYKTIKKMMLNRTLKNCDAIIALTQNIKKYLNYYGFNVSEVIPNAINTKDYKNGKDGNYILYSGRIVKHKKVDELIKVFSEIKLNSIELHIVGEGPEKKRLKKLIDGSAVKNKIKFFPYLSRQDYLKFLSECSIFVLPSITEAFGVVIIEAMASGKVVLARNIIGPADIINHSNDGFLFNDEKDFYSYLSLLIKDKNLRELIGKNAQTTVNQKYSLCSVADKYSNFYKSILRSK